MYYVIHRFKTLTRACLHLGSHSHPISEGDYRKTIEIVKGLVRQAFHTKPKAKTSAIAFGTQLLCHGNENVVTHIEGQSLTSVIDKFFGLSSPNVQNHVNALSFASGSKGFIDNF